MGIRPDFRIGPFRVSGAASAIAVVLVLVACCCGLYVVGRVG